jgi:hypothetical protein
VAAASLSCRSISRGGGNMPARGETSDFPSHGFQVLYFLGAPLALREVLLASQGIGRVQFVVEKSMEGELPFRTVAELTHAAIGRLDIGNVHEITESDLQLAPLIEGDFAESRLCQLHLSPPLRGGRILSAQTSDLACAGPSQQTHGLVIIFPGASPDPKGRVSARFALISQQPERSAFRFRPFSAGLCRREARCWTGVA